MEQEPGSGTVEPWPVLLQFTDVQAGRKGEEPKGNSKMTPSAESLQLGIELEEKPGPPRSCRKLSSRGIWEGDRSQPPSGTPRMWPDCLLSRKPSPKLGAGPFRHLEETPGVISTAPFGEEGPSDFRRWLLFSPRWYLIFRILKLPAAQVARCQMSGH